MNQEERLQKIEKMLYGDGFNNGLISNMIVMTSEVKNLTNAIKETNEELKQLQREIETRLNEIEERIDNQARATDEKINFTNTEIANTRSFVIKVASASASLGFIAGVIITLLLKLVFP